jgi:hypothetical protein
MECAAGRCAGSHQVLGDVGCNRSVPPGDRARRDPPPSSSSCARSTTPRNAEMLHTSTSPPAGAGAMMARSAPRLPYKAGKTSIASGCGSPRKTSGADGTLVDIVDNATHCRHTPQSHCTIEEAVQVRGRVPAADLSYCQRRVPSPASACQPSSASRSHLQL